MGRIGVAIVAVGLLLGLGQTAEAQVGAVSGGWAPGFGTMGFYGTGYGANYGFGYGPGFGYTGYYPAYGMGFGYGYGVNPYRGGFPPGMIAGPPPPMTANTMGPLMGTIMGNVGGRRGGWNWGPGW